MLNQHEAERQRELIKCNLDAIRARIESAARRSGRVPETVTLVAVTKKCSVNQVRSLVEAGVADLGENYPQELWRKAEALRVLAPPVRWHLIGHLQTNKARRTFPVVKMIHAVDSLKLLRVLDALARELPDAPSVCLQVNTSGEETKHGWAPDQVLQEADEIAACRTIRVVGLMTIAGLGDDAQSARSCFARLRQTRDALRQRTGLSLPELSMGMSGDFEGAIEEGATIVRVGSALFEGVPT